MLWVDLFGIYFGGESDSISAVEVRDSARYWRAFWGAFGVIEEIKSPFGGRGFRWGGGQGLV